MAEDLISVGAYRKGTNPTTDRAIALMDKINAFLRQSTDEKIEYSDVVKQLINITSSK
jgi:flagellum-specific ATP synthase